MNKSGPLLTVASVLTLGTTLMLGTSVSAEQARLVPAPTADQASNADKQATAVFAGGCFWGVQGVFQHVKGVTGAVSGYAGGTAATASYMAVSSGMTGHAESVKVTYDPSQVSYGKLLQIYFSVIADPTRLNAQGPDEGTQYRTDLFTMDPEQAKVAEAYIAQLAQARAFDRPIVTKVSSYNGFYPAEPYHQNYLTLHPNNAYIAYNDMPKVEALKRLFPNEYKNSPVLVSAK